MTDNRAPLTLLPEKKLHWTSFASSYGIEALALLLLIQISIFQPQKLAPRSPSIYQVTQLIGTPPPQRPAVRPPKNLLPPPPPLESPKLVANMLDRPPMRPIKAPELAPRPEALRLEMANILPPAPVKVPQIVHTGVFSTGSQAVPTINRPARDVQTGGFGDPNGVQGTGKPGAKLLVANTGSFDLPNGPGYGNGTGGARGVRGTVASVGFGTGIAQGNTERVSGRAIQQGGFGDARPVTEARMVRTSTPEPAPPTPVQILSKPDPVYTDEARRLKLEGEVLLEVTFSAKGECSVLRLVRGLGHGLDEAASRAAQQIRFRPATRNGQPVDSTATLHVLFQLAY